MFNNTSLYAPIYRVGLVIALAQIGVYERTTDFKGLSAFFFPYLTATWEPNCFHIA